MGKIALLAAAFGTLAACAPVGFDNLSKTERVDRRYSQMATGSAGVRTNLLAARAFEHEGKVAICAAIAEVSGGGTLRGEATDFLRGRALFFMQDDQVLRGAGFAPVHPATDVLAGETSKCVATSSPWKVSYNNRKLRLTIKRGRISN